MASIGGPNIVESGLVSTLDAGAYSTFPPAIEAEGNGIVKLRVYARAVSMYKLKLFHFPALPEKFITIW